MADSPWTITRLELVYYSRRHKRWQIWQEATESEDRMGAKGSAPGELYRAQIFSLLKTVRESLVEVEGVAGFEVATAPEIKKFIIGSGGLQDVLIRSGKFWLGYLQYIQGTAEHYGIPPSGGLGTFLNRAELKHLKAGEIDITREVALDLISMLPVLRHWDLQGCWVRALSGKTRDETCWSPKGKAPFYMAALMDSGAGKHTGPLLVEKPQKVELMYQDLAALDSRPCTWKPQKYGPADFFACCYKPTSGDELSLYQCYAFLFDKLLKMLNPRGDFFIAYPIEVLGRLNFLHLWVNSKAGKKLADLWEFWLEDSGGYPSISSPHSAVWPHLQEFLSMNLRGIHHATFQADWQRQIATPPKKGDPNPKTVEYSLCESANLLMPLDWIKWTKKTTARDIGQHALWTYQRYDCGDNKIEGGPGQEKEPWGGVIGPRLAADTSTGSLGAQWRCTPPQEDPSRHDAQETGSLETKDCFIKYAIRNPDPATEDCTPTSATARRKAILLGTVRLALEQQLALGEMFKKQQEAMQVSINAWIRNQLFPYCAVSANRASYIQMGTDSLVATFETGSVSDPVLRWELQKRFGKRASLRTLAEYVGADMDMLMNKKVPFHMSLYLEVGPIVALTHFDGDHWDQEERKLDDALHDLGAPELDSDNSDWWKAALALHQKATNKKTRSKIAGGKWRKEDRDYFEELVDLHNKVRCEHSYADPGPFGEAERVDAQKLVAPSESFRPFRPCAPILDEFGKSFRDLAYPFAVNECGTVYTGAILGKELPNLTKPGYVRTKPRLSTNIFAFKYSVDDTPDLKALATANGLRHLADVSQKYGKLIAGAQVNNTTMVQEVGLDYYPVSVETMCQKAIPALDCSHEQVFLAFLVETVRLK